MLSIELGRGRVGTRLVGTRGPVISDLGRRRGHQGISSRNIKKIGTQVWGILEQQMMQPIMLSMLRFHSSKINLPSSVPCLDQFLVPYAITRIFESQSSIRLDISIPRVPLSYPDLPTFNQDVRQSPHSCTHSYRTDNPLRQPACH